MAEIKVTEDTPTDSIVGSRPALVQLAQIVFDLKTNKAMRAFIQIRKNADLADIIDAKRRGIWDYGDHIVKTSTGYNHPNNDEVLELLHAAMAACEGGSGRVPAVEVESPTPEESFTEEPPANRVEQTEEHMSNIDTRRSELQQMAKRPLQRLHLAATGERTTRGEEAAPIIERILACEFPDSAPEHGMDDLLDDEQAEAELMDSISEDINPVPPADPEVVDNGPAPGSWHGGVTTTEGDLAHLARAIRGLAGLVEVVLDRQKVLSQITLLSSVGSLPEIPPQVMEDLAALNLVGEAPAPVVVDTHVDVPDNGNGATAWSNNEPVHTYSRADLTNMDMDDLRAIGKNLEVKNWEGQAVKAFLVRDILANQPKDPPVC